MDLNLTDITHATNRHPVALDAAASAATVASHRLAALSLSDVSHDYRNKRAVDHVSLSIGPGEIVCLVGPSGCGKSTLLRLSAGLETLQQGEVSVNGQVIARPGRSVPPEKRGIGLVFQDYALFPHLRVLDNVRFGLNRLPVAEQKERALAALRQVGMEAYANAFPDALSGGQQQRVALARAMAPKPAVLLLDEPFSGLDTRLRETVRDETLHVLKQSGAATMIVTHDPEEAMFLADRIALMRDGKLVQLGSPTALYTKPVDEFAASFFGEVNRLTGTVRGGRVDTPIGCLSAPGHAEGAAVAILIRPEGLRLSAVEQGLGSDGVPNLARVEASRLLGRASLVHLRVLDAEGRPHHMHARMPGHFLPADDTHVSVALDRQQAFIFPR
ncbi:ABC transporter ATP-binding protein [Niveispirillum sp. SYP-B3756]|uniref:ABC transporter ATP-binding protein n=1 Tax=Niveispirillum sp. SYP-B3756 TaxID=2662178 RepID=UPI001565F41A|nr:ABC transporter ATP-binding protein [Niveispirillum sp. SYP-B3756]